MKKRLILVAMVVVAALIVTSCGKDKLTANTMRMLKHEGVVKLFDANKKELTLSDNLRLNSGTSLLTEVQSLAGLALDDAKFLTIDELSKILINKDGKKLSVDLEEGSLFFEVTEKLDADASFDIRTSTMVVGIRGTSGIVTTNEKGEDVVIVTDGTTEVTAVDLGTGKTVSTFCESGHSVTAHVQSTDQGEEVTFDDAQVKPADLNTFALNAIRESDRLMEVVPAATGWSQDEIRDAEGVSGSHDSGSLDNNGDGTDAAAATASSVTETVTTDSASGASSEETLVASNTGATSTTGNNTAATGASSAASPTRTTRAAATGASNVNANTTASAAASSASSVDQDAAYQQFVKDLARAEEEQQAQQALERQIQESQSSSGSGGGTESTSSDTSSGSNDASTSGSVSEGTNNSGGDSAQTTGPSQEQTRGGTDSGTEQTQQNTSGTDTQQNTSGTETEQNNDTGTNGTEQTTNPENTSGGDATNTDQQNTSNGVNSQTGVPTFNTAEGAENPGWEYNEDDGSWTNGDYTYIGDGIIIDNNTEEMYNTDGSPKSDSNSDPETTGGDSGTTGGDSGTTNPDGSGNGASTDP